MGLPTTGLDIATFLGASIHDMKNSINVMQALLEDALSGLHTHCQCPATKKLDQVQYETRRVSDNLVQLLALYKIEREMYPFDLQEQDVGDFVHEAIARVSALAQFRGVTLSYDYPQDLYWYFEYELVLGSVVQAMHNALRYTRDQVRLVATVTDGRLEFRVEDNGSGYPESMLCDLPAPQRIRFATGSTGLGLYFSSVVAQLHKNRDRQGETRLENGSSLGGGTFILALP